MVHCNIKTLSYEYSNQDKEFVFSCKGRPFAVLVSRHLPTPTANFIDHNLVRELGLKMTNLQCKKIYFGGHQLRIIGKIQMKVQCIFDGNILGSTNLTASVIEDLKSSFDSHCIAGEKLAPQFQEASLISPNNNEDFNCTLSGASTPQSKRNLSPSLPVPVSTPTRPPNSPPGFPHQPQYGTAIQGIIAPKPPEILVTVGSVANFTPLKANLNALSETSCNADLMPNNNRTVRALHEADPRGKVQLSESGQLTFTTTSGLLFSGAHGQRRCHPEQCQPMHRERKPNNCGYHHQWLMPNIFQPCSMECRGAFCICLNDY